MSGEPTEPVLRIIEINPRELARAAEEHNKPCTCLSCSLYRGAWIEDVMATEDEGGTLHFVVEHSYPKGINIRKWVSDVITRCAPEGASWTLQTKRVSPKK